MVRIQKRIPRKFPIPGGADSKTKKDPLKTGEDLQDEIAFACKMGPKTWTHHGWNLRRKSYMSGQNAVKTPTDASITWGLILVGEREGNRGWERAFARKVALVLGPRLELHYGGPHPQASGKTHPSTSTSPMHV